jgi:peptide/nickel transport system ATP-binding protein
LEVIQEPILTVKDLKVYFHLDEGLLKAVDGVDFTVKRGRTLGLVGESGCGKSVTAQAILRIVPSPGEVKGEVVLYRNGGGTTGDLIDLIQLDPRGREIRAIRGGEISMIFQEPMKAFSPVHTIGNQIMEAILLHATQDKREAREIALSMLKRVDVSNPVQRLREYPHELSGGLRQRTMIAMALACRPSILIADEPTTALDVTVQAQVLHLIKDLQARFGMSVIFITHDLGVIAEMADEVAVMYLGRIVEHADVDTVFYEPCHPYTVALLASIPEVDKEARSRLTTIRGTVPVPINLGEGCGFFSRCEVARHGICDVEDPPLVEIGQGHYVRCFQFVEGWQ